MIPTDQKKLFCHSTRGWLFSIFTVQRHRVSSRISTGALIDFYHALANLTLTFLRYKQLTGMIAAITMPIQGLYIKQM